MDARSIRTTKGRGMLYDSILDTVGDTPVVRINNLAPDGVRLYVKIEFFNPGASVKDRLALNGLQPLGQRQPLDVGVLLRRALIGQLQIVNGNLVAADQRHCALEDVLELAHIAGKMIGLQHFFGLRRQMQRAAVRGMAHEYRLGQSRNVVAQLAQ